MAPHKSLRDRANDTVKRIQETIGESDEEKSKEMADAVEKAIIDALLEERERCATVAFNKCCDEDMDKAHKVAEEVRRLNTALVANLSSMR